MKKKPSKKKPPPIAFYLDLLEQLTEVAEVDRFVRILREEVGESEVVDRAVAAHLAKLTKVRARFVDPGVLPTKDDLARRLREAEIAVAAQSPQVEAEFWLEWFEVDPVAALEGIRREARLAARNVSSAGGAQGGKKSAEVRQAKAAAWKAKISTAKVRKLIAAGLEDEEIAARLLLDDETIDRSPRQVARYVADLRADPSK